VSDRIITTLLNIRSIRWKTVLRRRKKAARTLAAVANSQGEKLGRMREHHEFNAWADQSDYSIHEERGKKITRRFRTGTGFWVDLDPKLGGKHKSWKEKKPSNFIG